MIKAFFLAIIAWALAPLTLCAQLCTGSLGDPTLNETFGAGYNKLPSHKTSFDNVNGCPPKGTYTLSNFLFGCGDRTWGQMVGDHTGDYNGNYMLVNAESTPGNVYRDTAKGLCGNTFYQFGVYITTVMTKRACGGNPILPNIKYQVTTLSGTVLAADSTGFLPVADEKQWKFYGLAFTSPAGISDAIVSITVSPVYGCGSAFALDDITLRACGPTISASVDGSAGPAEVCADYTNPFIIKAAYSAGFGDPVLQWQTSVDTGKTWVDIAGQTTDTYAIPHRTTGAVSFRVAIAERTNINAVKCRITSNPIFTSIHSVPAHTPPQSIFGCLDKNFLFPAPNPFAEKVLWTGPNGFSSTQMNAGIPGISYADTGLYQFRQTYAYGCTSFDTFYLKVYPGTTLAVQPVFPICEGQQEQLFASAPDSVGYQWTPATGLSNANIPNPVAKPADAVIYKVTITNRYGCKDSAFLKIDVYRNPVAQAGPDKTILAGDTAILNGVVKGTEVIYSWQPATAISDVNSATPRVYPAVNTSYTLQVVSTVGCGIATDNILVKVYGSFLVPNAFTPNGDGKNDVFEVLTLDNYTVDHLVIYNRYGQPVFSSKGSYKAWDGRFKGTPQPQGIYVYHLEIRAPSRPAIVKKGTLLLIR